MAQVAPAGGPVKLDLRRLRTSLTKHGAHKIALLLLKVGPDKLLASLWGKVNGINIEAVQARKNLSVGSDGKVPSLWGKAKALGEDAVLGLTLIAIIFSHHDLIRAMKAAQKPGARGVLKRGVVVDEKAFTNFAHTIEELGFSKEHTKHHVSFDLGSIFEVNGLGPLAAELIGLKCRQAGWDGNGAISDVAIANHLHLALGIKPEELRAWFGDKAIELPASALGADEAFFTTPDDVPAREKFVFRPGHFPKKTGKVVVGQPKTRGEFDLKHNELQTSFFEVLSAKFGKANVGTENKASNGTSIDLVVKHNNKLYTFYEIKVGPSLRACIRAAIPQLLEYAYWRDDYDVVKELFIVSSFKNTKDAEQYLALLRKKFMLPIHYLRHQ